MGYATVSQVQALNLARATYSASSRPTASQVIGYLEQVTSELDSILVAKGAALPISSTATVALKLLERYAAQGAACLVERSGENDARADAACAMWSEMKKALADGTVDLDLPTTAGGGARYTVASPIFAIPDELRGGGVDRAPRADLTYEDA